MKSPYTAHSRRGPGLFLTETPPTASPKHLFHPLFPRTPHFPALQSDSMALSGASRRKQSPSSTGDASLGATRTLTVETGGTVAGTFVEFAGEISGDTFGISKEGAGTLLLSGTSTYTGATTVSAGTLYVTGSLSNSAVTVEDNAALGGAGVVASVSFEGDSRFDIFEAIANTAALISNSISFSTPGFGIENLIFNGLAVDWSTITNGTYTLIIGTLDETNLNDLGSEKPYGTGGGRSAYFENSSLKLVVFPEPSAALLGSLGILMRRRSRA